MQNKSEKISLLVELIGKKSALLTSDHIGYPIGTNCVYPPLGRVVALPPWIDNRSQVDFTNFYDICDGINLPDVHNGIFLHRQELIERQYRENEIPKKLRSGQPIFVFGSSGGGELFAVFEKDSSAVHKLSVAAIWDGEYDDAVGKITKISDDFPSFLEKIIEDLNALLDFCEGWEFIT